VRVLPQALHGLGVALEGAGSQDGAAKLSITLEVFCVNWNVLTGSTFKMLVGTAQEGAGLTFEMWHSSTENRAGPGFLRAIAREYGPAPSCGQAHYQQ